MTIVCLIIKQIMRAFLQKNCTRSDMLKFCMDVSQTFIHMLDFSDFCEVPA